MIRLEIKKTTYNKILRGKLQKYQYHHLEQSKNVNVLPVKKFYLSRIIKQAKITYLPLGKAFEKQIKTIEDQGRKQVQTLKVLKPEERQKYLKSIEEVLPKEMRTNEIKKQKIKTKNWEEKTKRKKLKYKTKNKCMVFSNIK